MTSREIIMTIKLKKETTFDVSEENGVFNLPIEKDSLLAASVWSSNLLERSKAFSDIFKLLEEQIQKQLPEYQIWFYIGTNWQPKNHIVLYQKLWKGLEMRGIKIPQETIRAKEIMIEDGDKVCFCSALKVEQNDFDLVLDLLNKVPSYFAVVRSIDALHTIISTHWNGYLADREPTIKFFNKIKNIESLIISKVGYFDEIENGFMIVGSPKLVQKLISTN
jgi:hypothetical protein